MFIGIAAIEQDNGVGPRTVRQHPQQIGLGSPGFGEYDRLLRRTELARLCETNLKRGQQSTAFGILLNRRGERGKLAQLGYLCFKRPLIFLAERLNIIIVAPFLFRFVEGFVIFLDGLGRRRAGCRSYQVL